MFTEFIVPGSVKQLVATLTSQAVKSGSDAVTERLLQSIQLEFLASKSERDVIAAFRELSALADEVRSAAVATPLISHVLDAVVSVAAMHFDKRLTTGSECLGFSISESIDSLVDDLRRARLLAARHAAIQIGPNATVCLFEVGDRHLALAAALTEQFGARVRLAVCSMEEEGTQPHYGASRQERELIHHITHTLSPEALPMIERVAFRDVALAVSQSDWVFLLIAGIGQTGQLIVPSGAELIYHSALAYGKNIAVIADERDVSVHYGLSLGASAYTVLQPALDVIVFSAKGASIVANFGTVNTGIDSRFVARTSVANGDGPRSNTRVS